MALGGISLASNQTCKGFLSLTRVRIPLSFGTIYMVRKNKTFVTYLYSSIKKTMYLPTLYKLLSFCFSDGSKGMLKYTELECSSVVNTWTTLKGEPNYRDSLHTSQTSHLRGQSLPLLPIQPAFYRSALVSNIFGKWLQDITSFGNPWN